VRIRFLGDLSATWALSGTLLWMTMAVFDYS
jgi:hypothetical protein